MKKGDIILIPFPFTDLSGKKLRPALVLFQGRYDIIVAFITTTWKAKFRSDIKLSMNEENGLKKDSILRLNKLATLDTNLAVGVIGNIGKKILHLIDRKLIEIFDIKIEKRN